MINFSQKIESCMDRGNTQSHDNKVARHSETFMRNSTQLKLPNFWASKQVIYVIKSKLYIHTCNIGISSFQVGFNHPCSSTGFYSKSKIVHCSHEM